MCGRPDLIASGQTLKRSFAQWLGGFNERIDVTQTYPVEMAATFQRGGHGLFGTARDYFRFAQMLANGGELEGARVFGRKTLELMHINHLPLALEGPATAGLRLRPRLALDVAETGSAGEFGWAGAAKTHYWVEARHRLCHDDLPELDLRAFAYKAIVDQNR
jgi:CubicO group peptidase (beta-lactamase class C family)